MSRSICHVVDAVVPEPVTWYDYFLEQARKKRDRRLIRFLLRMGRGYNSSAKHPCRFLVQHTLATNPRGLTVNQLRDKLSRHRVSREAIFRALKDLRKDGVVRREREKRETDAHVFPRSFMVYRLTKKRRKGIVLPSDKPASDFSGPYMLEKDKYGHWRQLR
jgi:hypothetical protein